MNGWTGFDCLVRPTSWLVSEHERIFVHRPVCVKACLSNQVVSGRIHISCFPRIDPRSAPWISGWIAPSHVCVGRTSYYCLPKAQIQTEVGFQVCWYTEGRGHVYTPRLNRPQTAENRSLRRLSDNLVDSGKRGPFETHLLRHTLGPSR